MYLNIPEDTTIHILNIASGYLPLCPQDFPFLPGCVVYNFDILTQTPITLADFKLGEQGPLRNKMYQLPILYRELVASGDLSDANVYFDMPTLLSDTTQIRFDIVISISPYGFQVMNNDIDTRLLVGSYVVLFGNRSNKYIKEKDAISQSISAKYKFSRIPNPESYDGNRLKLDRISTNIFSFYKSHKTDPTQQDPETEIQCTFTYEKIHP